MAIVKLLKIEFSRKFRRSVLSALSLPERTKHNTTIKKSLSAQCVCVFFFYCNYRSDFSLCMMSSSSKSSSTGERVAPIRSHVRFYVLELCTGKHRQKKLVSIQLGTRILCFEFEYEIGIRATNTGKHTQRHRQTLNDARWGASPRLTT